MKNVNDKYLCIAILLFVIALFAVRASAQQFVFKGVYNVQDVIINYCDDCFLQLPPDYLNSQIVLSVMTDDNKNFIKALQTSSRAIGWDLNLSKDGKFRAEPLQNTDNLVFISCMDNQPRNVPKYLYSASIRSDKLQCVQRDSLARLARQKAVNDSIRVDSIRRARLPFGAYELRYYSYTKNFTDKIGAEFSGVVANGNLHNKFKIFDDWQFFATSTNDTSFTYRQINVAFDSLLNVDWGTEEQTLKTSYVTSSGVVNNDYEWRKYGLIVTMRKDNEKTYLSYVFRDKEQNISVLQGSAVGKNGDTLVVTGQYTTSRVVRTGVPFIGSVPILGLLFSTEQTLTDVKRFELYLVPTATKGGRDDRQDTRALQTATAATETATAADSSGAAKVVE